MKRTIIIGDLHGCLDELDELIQQVQYKPGTDSLYFLGDIINRGPHSKEAFQRVIDLDAISIIGNHEWHILEAVRQKRSDFRLEKLQQEFGSDFKTYLNEIRNWPLFIEKDDFILVHGGLIPGRRLEESEPHILVSIRTWDGVGKDLNNSQDPPWFEHYHQEKLVVFGHWAKLEGVVRKNVIGLDTGCVYGKKLTALILPERRLVSVAARKNYYTIRN